MERFKLSNIFTKSFKTDYFYEFTNFLQKTKKKTKNEKKGTRKTKKLNEIKYTA